MPYEVIAFICALLGFMTALTAHALHLPWLAAASAIPAGLAIVFLLLAGRRRAS